MTRAIGMPNHDEIMPKLSQCHSAPSIREATGKATVAMRLGLLLAMLILFTAGCIQGYRGPGTYPGYVQPAPTAMPEIPPLRWAPPPYPGGPLFRTQ